MGADRSNEYLPDLDSVPEAVWKRCQVLFLCSPGNPTGAVASIDYLRRALELADRHDFVVASDECYSEIYLDEAKPPPGLLQAALAAGHDGFERCVVFHSLSKRSSVPGLRSGFVAGDARLIKLFLLYRTYHGCAMPIPTQLASVRPGTTTPTSSRIAGCIGRSSRPRCRSCAKRCTSMRRTPASICGLKSPTTSVSPANCSSVST